MKIEYINIEEIKPYKNNPRINKEAVPKVKRSIEKYGFRNPVLLDKKNEIIAGHTRLLAAKELDLKEIPCIYITDLTDKQIKEFRLVDNKTNEFSDWDYELLDVEMQDIDFLEIEEFGFEDLGAETDSGAVGIDMNKERETIECPNCGFEIEV